MKKLHSLVLCAGALCGASAAAADLYQEATYRSIVADVKAHRLGDSLTVLVMETSSAASTADTNAKRATDVSIHALSDVGRFTRKGEMGANVNNDFSGVARTQRAGKLLAQITVTVVGVEPNGDLRIAGEQLLEVNDEKQMISLEGKVRPEDVSENNSVVSNRIADAKIHYVGDGVLADGQKPGLITRVLTWLGL